MSDTGGSHNHSWETWNPRVSSLFARPSAARPGPRRVSREAPQAVARRMSGRPPAPLPLPAASPPATRRWLRASNTMRALACLALCMDRVTIASRRHGGGQRVHGIILTATIGAEQPQLASGHGRSQRRPGGPRFFPPWARWALCRWLRIRRLAPLAARPPPAAALRAEAVLCAARGQKGALATPGAWRAAVWGVGGARSSRAGSPNSVG